MKKNLIFCFFITFIFACGGINPDFSTPQYTLRTYVNAYNEGNGFILRKCGMASDLDRVFTKVVEGKDGEKILIPLENIRFRVRDIKEGEMSISKYYQTFR